MKKIFKWLLLFSSVLAIGIAMLLYKPGLFKKPLENYLSKLSGYTISINGSLDISVGKQLSLSVTEVQITNPQGGSENTLLELASMNLVVNGASLFTDTIEVAFLQIDDLQVRLVRSAEEPGNWVTGKQQSSSRNDKKREPAVIFSQLKLNKANLVYLNSETGRDFELHIASYDQQQQHDGMLEINLIGALNQRLLEYAGSIGTYKNLLAGKDIAFNGNGHFGSLTLAAEGLIDDLLDPRQPQFKIDLQGPDTDDVTAMLEIDDLGTGDFSLSARGETINGQYTAGIHGGVGDLTVHITAEATDLLELDTVDLKMAINGPRLGAVTRIFGIQNWPDKPFSLKGGVRRVGSTLNIPDLRLNIGGAELSLDAALTNFPNLDDSRINLSLEGDDIVQFRQLLGIPGIATGEFSINGKLESSPEHVELIQVDLKTSLGQATLSGTLGPGPKYIGTKLHVNMHGHDANLLMLAFGVDVLPNQPFKLDARVELLEEGLQIKRGVLLSIDDDRLDLGGLISFNRGGVGSNFDFSLGGRNLSEMLGRLGGGQVVPEKPYQLSSRVRLLEEGIDLENFKAEFEDIELAADGLIIPGNEFTGTAFDFKISGENLSSLKRFPAIGNSVNIFVPGQAYRLGGKFFITDNSWRLEKISGKVGVTDIAFDSLLTPQDPWIGSTASFSIKGPDFHSLIIDKDKPGLSLGRFTTRGTLALMADTVSISDFNFNTDRIHGKMDLQLGWPFNSSKHIRYDVDIAGDDIRHIFPDLNTFEPALADFKIRAIGQSSRDKLAVQKFEARVGGLQVSLSGGASGSQDEKNMVAAIRAVTTDISRLGKLNGEPMPPLALDLTADFDGGLDEFSIRNIYASLGESRFSGSLGVSLKAARPLVDLRVNSPNIDLRPFLLADRPNAATPTSSNKRVIPATPFPLDKLKLLDGKLKLNIDKLQYRHGDLQELLLEAELSDGALNIPRVSAKGPDGQINAVVSLMPISKDRVAMKADVSAKDLRMNIFGQLKDNPQQMPLIDLALKVHGSGGNLQELAGSLNGSIHMGSEGGILKGINLSVLDTFFLEELIRVILPSTGKSEDLYISCAAAMLKITDGLLETDPALSFISRKITLIAKGSLDLKTEKINFNFNTIPNKAYKVSASELINPYILVSGTLMNPAIGVDPAKALVHGGIAVGTAGISILAKGALDRLVNTAPLCEQMLEQMQER